VKRDGKKHPYHMESIAGGERIYIGSQNQYVQPGTYQYEITYVTTQQLRFFDQFDELNWNVTGNGWVFPIDKVEAIIRLPKNADLLQSHGYTGPEGTQGDNYEISRGFGEIIRYRTTQALGAYEGLTVALAWPKGFVVAPSKSDKFWSLFIANPGLFYGFPGLLLVFFYFYFAW